MNLLGANELTHWGRVTHICFSKLTIIGSDNGLSPGRRQAIIWTNAGILLIGPLGTNFSEIIIEILKFSFKKMRMKVSSVKRRPFCLGLNVLNKRFIGHNNIACVDSLVHWYSAMATDAKTNTSVACNIRWRFSCWNAWNEQGIGKPHNNSIHYIWTYVLACLIGSESQYGCVDNFIRNNRPQTLMVESEV